jgi:hypothetical protein
MNASLWQLAGWTMIHSLWLGCAVALAGGFLRLACRRAAPNTRYAISLATLAALAATPLAVATWLSVNGIPHYPSPRYSGERLGEGLNPLSITPQTSATVENPSPNPSLQGRGEGTPGRMPGLSGQAIDLAHATPAELDALAAQAQPAASPTTTSPLAPPIPHSSFPISPTTYSPTHLLTYSLAFSRPSLTLLARNHLDSHRASRWTETW